ncbi:hypothetical protein [Aeromonas intestinalis]
MSDLMNPHSRELPADILPVNGNFNGNWHGVMPTQNGSTLTHAPVPPALQADAIASSVEGRGIIKPGMPGYQVQELYDQLAGTELELAKLGKRPVATASIPNMSDSRAPFGGKSVSDLLRASDIPAVHIQSEAARLRHMSAVLPEIRRGLMAASGESRASAYRAALVTAKAIVSELEAWGPDVLKSAEQEPGARAYDSIKRNLEARLRSGKAALARLSAESVGNFVNAVTSARQEKELTELRKLVQPSIPEKQKK